MHLDENTHKMNFFLQVIILARESGLKLELSDLPVHSLVPEPLRVRHFSQFHIGLRKKFIFNVMF